MQRYPQQALQRTIKTYAWWSGIRNMPSNKRSKNHACWNGEKVIRIKTKKEANKNARWSKSTHWSQIQQGIKPACEEDQTQAWHVQWGPLSALCGRIPYHIIMKVPGNMGARRTTGAYTEMLGASGSVDMAGREWPASMLRFLVAFERLRVTHETGGRKINISTYDNQ